MPMSFVALLLSVAAAAAPGAEAPPAAPAPAEAAPVPGATPPPPEAAPAPPRPPSLRELNLARAEKGLLPRKAPPRRTPRRLRVVSAREQVARAQLVDGASSIDLVPAAAQAEPIPVIAGAPDRAPPAPAARGGAASLAGAVIRGLAAARGGGPRAAPSARVEAEPGGLRASARGATVEVTVRARAGALALVAGPGAR